MQISDFSVGKKMGSDVRATSSLWSRDVTSSMNKVSLSKKMLTRAPGMNTCPAHYVCKFHNYQEIFNEMFLVWKVLIEFDL